MCHKYIMQQYATCTCTPIPFWEVVEDFVVLCSVCLLHFLTLYHI